MSAVRGFMAIELPPSVVTALLQASQAIRIAAPHWRDDKWVSEQNLHITLKFLGNVEAHVLETLQDDFGAAFADVDSFPMRLEKTLALPSHGRRNMVWAVFADPTGECAALASLIDDLAARHGVKHDTRPFLPHATLVRSRKPRKLAAEALGSANAEIVARKLAMSVSSATLLTSKLTPTGPVYERVAKWTLSPRG